MTAPVSFRERSDSFPLHRGRRPYMTQTGHLQRQIAVLHNASATALQALSQGAATRVCRTSQIVAALPTRYGGSGTIDPPVSFLAGPLQCITPQQTPKGGPDGEPRRASGSRGSVP